MATSADIKAVKDATEAREIMERNWREAIASAANEGCSLREIAAVAGVTHTRVHQIVVEMREGTFRN